MDGQIVPLSEASAAGRLWRFGDAVFDEGRWTLTVDGQRVNLENKPLKLLRELLIRPGTVVRKDELLDAVWPGVTVVEGSLTTAMNKLRRALGDRDGAIIETVPGIGYRLAISPLAATGATTSPSTELSARNAPVPRAAARRRLVALGAGVLLGVFGAAMLYPAAVRQAPRPITHLEVLTAMRALDLAALRDLIERGWNPRAPIGSERNSAIGAMLEICEWKPDHDKDRLALAVRLLLDAGARATDRNVWGDTPYSIASAPRYCGPNHPVTRLLKSVCMGSSPRIDVRCLADYGHSEWPQVTPRLGSARRAG